MEMMELGLMAVVIQAAATVYWVQHSHTARHAMPMSRLHGRVIPKADA